MGQLRVGRGLPYSEQKQLAGGLRGWSYSIGIMVAAARVAQEVAGAGEVGREMRQGVQAVTAEVVRVQELVPQTLTKSLAPMALVIRRLSMPTIRWPTKSASKTNPMPPLRRSRLS